MGVCCCLQTCKSVVNVLVMGLVLGQSLMVISSTGILVYYPKVSPLYCRVPWREANNLGSHLSMHIYITKYGSTLYIGMDEVFQHHAHTFEKSNLNFHFQCEFSSVAAEW